MASPFAYFRKHTALFTVLLGVMLMLAFVVADPLLQYLGSASGGGGRDRSSEVAVTWDGGRLTEGELANLVNRRQVLAGFLRTLYEVGSYTAFEAGVPANVPTRVAPLPLPTRPEEGVERDVVRTRLLAQAARDAGMVITDDTIREYLIALGRDYVTTDDMRTMISRIQLGRGNRATIDFMFGLLREALLARTYLGSYQYAMSTQLPQERWADWLKANDRVVVEAAAVPASEFLDEVEAPTEAELTAYYEEYKDAAPEPVFVQNTELPSPTPAFGIPRRAALQYLKAEFQPLVQQQLETVTEEEIEEFYEQNKDLFVAADSDLLDESELTGDDPSELELEVDTSTEEAPEDAAAPPSDRPDADSEDDPAAPSDDPSTEDTAAEDTAPDDEPASDDEPTSESTSARAPSPFRLVAMQQDASGDDPADDDGPSEAESSAAGPSENGPSENGPSEEAATDETADDDVTTDELVVEEQTDESAEGGSDEAPQDDEPSTADAREGEEAERIQPLEEVREEIRQQLAQVKANEQISEMFTEIETVLGAAYGDHFDAIWAARDAGEEEPAPPETLADLKPIAEKYGLEYGKTDALSIVQLRDTPIGETFYQDASAGQSIPVWVQAFRRDSKAPYEAFPTSDGEQNRYLVMVTERLPAETPPLDEIRDEVVRAWKMQKAGELALERAEELAETASQSGGSLEDLLANDPDVEVFRTDPFSWLTIGNVSRSGQVTLRLSDPAPVVAAGPEFMEAVFGLSAGEVGAAPNHDKSIAYVVRVAERLDTQAQLRQDFLQEWDRWYGVSSLSQDHIRGVFDQVYQHLVGEDGLDWKRPPDRTAEELMAEEEG